MWLLTAQSNWDGGKDKASLLTGHQLHTRCKGGSDLLYKDSKSRKGAAVTPAQRWHSLPTGVPSVCLLCGQSRQCVRTCISFLGLPGPTTPNTADQTKPDLFSDGSGG